MPKIMVWGIIVFGRLWVISFIPNGFKPFGMNPLNSGGLYARREATGMKPIVIESWLFTAKTFTDVICGLTRI
ncbi:MAG: hypothetical protein ACO1PI_07735 [Bacteroidota bacterium]